MEADSTLKKESEARGTLERAPATEYPGASAPPAYTLYDTSPSPQAAGYGHAGLHVPAGSHAGQVSPLMSPNTARALTEIHVASIAPVLPGVVGKGFDVSYPRTLEAYGVTREIFAEFIDAVNEVAKEGPGKATKAVTDIWLVDLVTLGTARNIRHYMTNKTQKQLRETLDTYNRREFIPKLPGASKDERRDAHREQRRTGLNISIEFVAHGALHPGARVTTEVVLERIAANNPAVFKDGFAALYPPQLTGLVTPEEWNSFIGSVNELCKREGSAALLTEASKHGLVNLVTVGLAASVQTYRNTHDEKELIRLLQRHNSTDPFVSQRLRAQYNKAGHHINLLYAVELE